MQILHRCLLAALVADFFKCTEITKGLDFVASPFTVDSVATTALSPDEALFCYRDVQTSSYIRCKALNIVGSSMTEGPGILIEVHAVNISVASFSVAESLLCYQNTSSSKVGTCTVLKLAGADLTRGPDYVINSYDTGAISTAVMTYDTGIMCYGGGDSLTCNSLVRECQGSSCIFLRKEPYLALNLERPVEVALTTVSSTKVCVCWRGASTDSPGKCAMLHPSDSSKGTDVSITSGDLQATRWYASIAALSPKVVVVCYQDINGASKAVARCNALRVIGMKLHLGPNLDISDGSTGAEDVTVVRLSDILAVVCYRGGMVQHYTTCNALNLFGNSLTKGPDLVVHTEGAMMTSASALSETKALVCYRATSKVPLNVFPGRGLCNILVAKVTPVTAAPSETTTAAVSPVGPGVTSDAKRRLSLSIWVWTCAVWTFVLLSHNYCAGRCTAGSL